MASRRIVRFTPFPIAGERRAVRRRSPPHILARRSAERFSSNCDLSAEVNNVHVDKVTVGYYDSGDVLQPVYRFEATVNSPDARLVTNRHLLGYVSIGDAPESLPVLGVQRGPSPAEPLARSQHTKTSARALSGDPTVGRYVVRDDSPDWVSSANDFMANLEFAQALFGVIQFTDSQYYWAEPWEFLADKNAFVNDVQIALNEVHGNWGLFSTRDNHDDIVRLSDAPAGGYGGAVGARWPSGSSTLAR